ncbi:MAG: hypothetical protein QOG73_2449 [Acetobacteraceae bacterium]|nr:hypothetical protein [Acetobacteraceae bacterium]
MASRHALGLWLGGLSACRHRQRLARNLRPSEYEYSHHKNMRFEINAVFSVVLGGHYPVGEIPRPEIEQARAQLASSLT